MTRSFRRVRTRQHGFTMMELMTVLVIVLILATMASSAWTVLQAKADRGKCVHNLQMLYAAASSYLADKESWPQIPTYDVESAEYANAWIAAFAPYQLGQVNWICPTVQKGFGNPTLDAQNSRVDYMATPFDNKPSSPRRYGTQPWFIERANVHSDGNLLIYASGQIKTLNEAKRDAKSAPNPFN